MFKKVTLFFLLIIFINCNVFADTNKIHKDLWKGIVAEDTRGDFLVSCHIASCVRNRLRKGMTHGLVAMKRKNLNLFVIKECNYALKTKHINLEYQAKRAIHETFVLNKDYVNGATYYEHTGKYPAPPYTRNMRIVKVLYADTKDEITFWKER